MKKFKNPNVLLLSLTFIFIVSSLIFVITFTPVRAQQISHFRLVEAASIRIADDSSGIRFRVEMDEQTANYIKEKDAVTIGFIITPKYYFDKAQEDIKSDLSYDYLSDMKLPSGGYAYVGEDGVGILVLDEEKSIYKEGSYYYANGAVQNIKVNNVELGFTAIAYINDNGVISYYLPSEDFERSYYQTAVKAYIEGEFTLDDIRGADFLSDIGCEDKPIEISSGEELTALSNNYEAVYSQTSLNYILIDDVTVDYDFTIFPDAFRSYLNTNDKRVTMYNQLGATSLFESETPSDCVIDNKSKLFNATEKAENTFITSNLVKTDTKYSKDIANDTFYEGNINALSTSEGGLNIQLNMPKTALEYRDYAYANSFNAVNLYYSFMPTASANLCEGALTCALGETNNSLVNAVIDIDTFISCFGALSKSEGDSNPQTVIPDINSNNLVVHISDTSESGWTFYLGDMEFVNWDGETCVLDKGDYNLTANAKNETKLYETSEDIVSIVENSSIPTENIYSHKAYEDNAWKISDVNHNEYYYVDFTYTAEEYQKLAMSKGFNAVKFSYLCIPRNTDTTAYLTHNAVNACLFEQAGSLGRKLEYNAWTENVVTIEEFIECFDHLYSNTLRLLCAYKSNNSSDKFDLYMSSFEFIEFDFFDFTPTASMAINNKVEGYSNEGCYSQYVLGSQNTIIPNSSEKLSNPINYTGDAVRIYNVGTQSAPDIRMPYTVDEYKELQKEYNWSGVTFTYAMTYKPSKFGDACVLGQVGSVGEALTWHTAQLTMAQFYNAFDMDNPQILNFRTSGFSKDMFWYIGNIKFIF